MQEFMSPAFRAQWYGDQESVPQGALIIPCIPLQEIVTKIENGAWDAKPTHVFDYKDIQSAHKLLDSHAAGGKIVVKH